MAISKTEDNVRDNSKIVLGFDDNEKNVQQGTGQITTFNKFGIKSNKKPDGWYLPNDIGSVAIILETKANSVDIHVDKWRDELLENVQIASSKYSKVIGILYNGEDIRVFRGNEELTSIASTLQHKSYYIKLYLNEKIDKQKIYRITKQINDCLHTKFGIKNLYHRMIFTACALVAKRYGAFLDPNMDFPTMKTAILSKLDEQLTEDK